MSGFRLRSVNLRDDVGAPERLSHYQPTRRSAPVIRAVLQGGATMVMAAYGSGKSLAAGVGALSVINKDKNLVRSFAERLKPVDPDLSLALARRLEQRARGRVVVLNGQVRDLPGALADAFDLPRKRGIDAVLGALEGLAETDHVAVVWDEFGRHLEGIVNEGRARELDAVQRLAEWAVRAAALSQPDLAAASEPAGLRDGAEPDLAQRVAQGRRPVRATALRRGQPGTL